MPTQVVKTYNTSTIDITVDITAHHEGHFEFFICNAGAKGTVTQECFEKKPLARSSDGYANPASAVDKDYPGRYDDVQFSMKTFPKGAFPSHDWQ